MVFEMLKDFLAESLGCDAEEISLRSELREDLGLSDTALEEVLDAMSGELGFRYDADDLSGIATVGQLVRYISNLV